MALVPQGFHISPPPLLQELEFSHASSTFLSGKVCYKWGQGLGWLVGTPAKNKLPDLKKKGVVVNFSVTYAYDGEEADHVLSLDQYAKGGRSAIDSWLLLLPNP